MGFAVSTISMALRDDSSIPSATCQKIQDRAREMGYQPNPLLAALASKHFSSKQSGGTPIAYLRFSNLRLEDEVFTQRIIEIQEEHARKLGYRLEAFKVSDFQDGKEAGRILFSRGYQGILLETHFQLDMLPGMDWNRFAVVGWGEGMEESSDSSRPMLSRAIVNHFGSVKNTWAEVSKRGYRKIGFVLFSVSETLDEDQIRFGAALTCLERTPLDRRVPTLFLELNFYEIDSRRLGKWARRHRPDAIIGFNGTISLALKHEGFRIPEDIGFASLHVDVDAQTLLGLKQRDSGMKEMRTKSMLAAVELLDQQIRHRQYGFPQEPRTMMIDAEWIEGTTLPDKREGVDSGHIPPSR